MSLNPMSLENQRILVTGASSGIGRETASLVAKLGGKVTLVGRNHERLNETLSQLEGAGHFVSSFDLNATDEIPNWIKSLAKEHGSISGIVHAAGVHVLEPLRMLTSEQISELMTVNVQASIGLAKGLRMKGVRSENASLVLLSSVAAFAGDVGLSAYSAAKGALIAATRSLAHELARESIRVNCIAPGMVLTEMAASIQRTMSKDQWEAVERRHLLGLGKPVDVANAAAFLLASTSRWITGTTLVVDGGFVA